MRMLLAAAGAALLAGPASAQSRHTENAQRVIDEAAPAVDRTTQALLNLDIGPILDAADPTRPHHNRTLRDMARRDDPDFERHLRASIYGNAASLHRMTAAVAAAEPALRQALSQFEASIAAAMSATGPYGAPYAPPPPRGYAQPPRGYAEPPEGYAQPPEEDGDVWDAEPMDDAPPPPPEPEPND